MKGMKSERLLCGDTGETISQLEPVAGGASNSSFISMAWMNLNGEICSE
jgi:hypothetical protein